MIRRITLIEPENEHLHIFSKFVLPRLGTILLATIMRDRGYAARTIAFFRRHLAGENVDEQQIISPAETEVA